jgi:hypothetical protein
MARDVAGAFEAHPRRRPADQIAPALRPDDLPVPQSANDHRVRPLPARDRVTGPGRSDDRRVQAHRMEQPRLPRVHRGRLRKYIRALLPLARRTARQAQQEGPTTQPPVHRRHLQGRDIAPNSHSPAMNPTHLGKCLFGQSAALRPVPRRRPLASVSAVAAGLCPGRPSVGRRNRVFDPASPRPPTASSSVTPLLAVFVIRTFGQGLVSGTAFLIAPAQGGQSGQVF